MCKQYYKSLYNMDNGVWEGGGKDKDDPFCGGEGGRSGDS